MELVVCVKVPAIDRLITIIVSILSCCDGNCECGAPMLKVCFSGSFSESS